jgi:hypothetical protein
MRCDIDRARGLPLFVHRSLQYLTPHTLRTRSFLNPRIRRRLPLDPLRPHPPESPRCPPRHPPHPHPLHHLDSQHSLQYPSLQLLAHACVSALLERAEGPLHRYRYRYSRSLS